jgi:uncharacterized protein
MLAGCSPAETPLASSTAETKASGSVWVATSDTGGKLYLCGTIHILRESDYPLAPAYEAAYADAQKLVFELPPGSGSGGDMNAQMQKLAALPKGATLEDIIGKEMAASVFTWAGKRRIPTASVSGYQPWYVALMIAAVEYGELGAQPDKGVDSYFESRAAHDKKPGEGLETVAFQIGLFSRLTAVQQKELLQQTLQEVKTIPEEFSKMIAAWKEGDLVALHEMLFREAARYPDLMNIFLLDRNKTWIKHLDESLKKGERVMLLVGAGHLTGKEGLIELLKAKGYQVERYKSAN